MFRFSFRFVIIIFCIKIIILLCNAAWFYVINYCNINTNNVI